MSTVIRPLQQADLSEARRIFRVAFGTFIGLPNPDAFAADREYVFTRWRAFPEGALAAEVDGALAGSNFLTRWGSFGFFGPLTVRPDLWNQRIAQALLGPTVDLFTQWGVRDLGLFTFANSTKHVALYQKFGFWPRFLSALMACDVKPRAAAFQRFSALDPAARQEALAACRELTGAIHPGLDVAPEIRSVFEQQLGDTVLISGDRLDALAVCHCGPVGEAGNGNCYLKFAAARDESSFGRMLDACESLAAERGLQNLNAGVNLARSEAYRHMLARGFRSIAQGVAMQRPDTPGFNRPGVFVIDDWR